MPYTGQYKFPIGIYKNPPITVNYAPTLYRNMISEYAKNLEGEFAGDSYNGIPTNSITIGQITSTMSTPAIVAGMPLYELDGFGTPTETNKVLYWDYQVIQVDNDFNFVLITSRLCLIDYDEIDPEPQILATYNNGFGGVRYVANLKIYFGVVEGTNEGNDYVGPVFMGTWDNTYNGERNYKLSGPGINLSWFDDNHYKRPTEKTDPNDDDDPSGEDGGDGDRDDESDPVPVPGLPDLGAASAGMITMYRMSAANMQTFSSSLWDDAWTQIRAFFSDPMDFIIGCMMLPVEPQTSGSARPKFGSWTSDYAYSVISDQFIDIDLGTVEITKFFGSCFDYDPYTKIEIFLPYIGYRELPTDDVMGHTIGVNYHVDCLTGDCTAFVHVVDGTPHVVCQFNGNVGVQVPMSRATYNDAVRNGISLLGTAVGIATAGAIGGAAGAAAAAAPAVSQTTVSAVTSMKSGVKRSGALGGSAGAMGVQTPFIVRRIPRQSWPSNYAELNGYPANIGGYLSAFSGLTVCSSVKLISDATDQEKAEIEKLLMEGVIL